MTYSIYLEQKGVTGPIPKPLNLWSLNEVDVEDLLQAINERHESVKIYGTVYEINDFKSINIFTEENQVSQESLRQHFKPWGSDDGYIAISGFMLLGRNVTTQFTNGVVPWGKTITSDYISSSTIRELRVISSSKYDLKKLVRLCEEINFNWKRKITIPLLL
ncbi:MAG: hypothetical protein IPG39_12625 [Bacteroidetes bacterium]|nr:hypothetical protein [Bacteroidota bacterium]